jgi:sigma-E factor negative regulatory protein RseC
MMTEKGRVIAVEDDGLWVETLQVSACEQCSAKSGCGQSLLANSLMSDMTCIKAVFNRPNTRIWQVGDSVDIGISETALLKATGISYMVPLLGLIAGACGSVLVGDSDLHAALGALFGLCSGFLISRTHAKSVQHRDTYHAIVID